MKWWKERNGETTSQEPVLPRWRREEDSEAEVELEPIFTPWSISIGVGIYSIIVISGENSFIDVLFTLIAAVAMIRKVHKKWEGREEPSI